MTQTPAFVSCIQPQEDPFVYYDNIDSKPSIKPVLPDRVRYEKALKGKSKLAVMGRRLQIGNFSIVNIDVSPLRYTADGTVELIEHLVLELVVEKDKKACIEPPLTNVQRYKEHSLVHELVENRELVRETPLRLKGIEKSLQLLPSSSRIPRLFKRGTELISIPKFVDYLIITDNNRWNAQTAAITGPAGNLVSEFTRLAAHKKNRGYRTHVAQVGDIISGKYGDFSSGARDLQEVIRNFLKHFVVQKGVEWVLLGGDTSIIPHRLACACAWGRVYPGSLDNDNQSVWLGTYLGMRVNSNELGATSHVLTNYNTGQRIPFDNTGSSNATNPGWYCTTDDTFAVRSAAPTRWIRVNGPVALVNAPMAWYTPTNMIPTDMYYSSLYGPLYNQSGKHDWDLLDNGLYGQHNENDSGLGGADLSVDIGIGRAPVETMEQAKIFVDKVISYDNWGAGHSAAGYVRFKKMLYVAEHWARYFHAIDPQPGNSFPPDDRHYYSDTTGGHALLHDSALPKENAGNKIICRYSDSARKVLEFNLNAGAGTPGWFYAAGPNNLTPSLIEINILYLSIKVPIPTEWVVVFGSDADITPAGYDIDKEETDSSIIQQEELREWVKSQFGRINQVQRLYSDVTDMPTGSFSGAGLKQLSSENLEQELNNGHHFVSLTGHGNWTGVAHLNHAMINRLSNGEHTFIAIADSCLTNKFDENDAIGESLLNHPQGGAVAYIGNSRYSWIGIGDDFRLQFFKAMKYSRNLATLNDSRCLFQNDSQHRLYKIWTILEQTLMGDPEMNVYRTDLDAFPKFIGNKNTMELHQSTCQWVKRMASWNMRYYDALEDAIALGYDGCAFCLKSYDHG